MLPSCSALVPSHDAQSNGFPSRIAPLPAAACPCPPCVRASDPVISTHTGTHSWPVYKLRGSVSGPFLPPARRADAPCSRIFGEMLMGAASSSGLDHICVSPILVSREKNLFSSRLQLRFSKKSSLQGPQNWMASERSPPAPTKPFPALCPFRIIPYYLGWKFLRAGELV